MRLSTRDVGLALREALEGKSVSPCDEHRDLGNVIFVDVSDANNPIIHLENGQNFTVRIIAT